MHFSCVIRESLRYVAITLLLFVPTPFARAQAYPAKPVRIVVGFAAGGAAEVAARVIAQTLTEKWGQQIVVDPRPGAGGTIATDLVAKSAPDGYTLIVCAFAHAVNPSLFSKLPFDTVKDFTPVALFASSANILAIHPSLPVNSLKEFIVLAKSQPDQLTFGSAGNGTASHLAGELLNSMAGIKLLHVPYKGSSLASTDLLGGHIASAFPNIVLAQPQVQVHRLRALGVTSLKRAASMPEVPTISEAGVNGFEVISWYGLLAPAGTPSDIINKLNGDINRALHEPSGSERLKAFGVEQVQMTPAEFDGFIRREIAKWAKVIKEMGVRAN